MSETQQVTSHGMFCFIPARQIESKFHIKNFDFKIIILPKTVRKNTG